MLKKKPARKPNDHDFSALDEAVSELTKQTEALLGKPDQKSKPALPKKHHKPQAKGKSFDIINHRKSSGTKATLKTAVPVKATIKVKAEESPPLLPDHAGKSYNELEGSEQPAKETQAEIKEVKVPATIQHHEGKLQLDPTPAPEAEVTPAKDEAATSVLEEPKPAAVAPSQEVSHTSISFETKDESTKESEEPESKPELDSEPDQASAEPQVAPEGESKPVEEETKSEDQEDTEDAESEEAAVEPPAYNSGELFANNLVKDSHPKGYKPAKNQQKPTVFDTNEYHPELHDWSKLEHRGGVRWLVLILLLALAGGLAYMLLSGQKLPFL